MNLLSAEAEPTREEILVHLLAAVTLWQRIILAEFESRGLPSDSLSNFTQDLADVVINLGRRE
jgi:hypothetical protein